MTDQSVNRAKLGLFD